MGGLVERRCRPFAAFMPLRAFLVNTVVDVRCRFLYAAHMTKTDPIGVRLEPEERAALERAAAADDRSLSAMARKIITEWLKKAGHLKRAPKR